MSTETSGDGDTPDETVDESVGSDAAVDEGEVAGSHVGTTSEVADEDTRNDVAVHFENGEVTEYAFVVRTDDADWLYAERLAAGGDGFDEEEIEALNAEKVCRITASRVHLFEEGVVHFGDDLVVDPSTLLEDSWFDAGATLL